MTRIKLVERLNQLTLRYGLTWESIKDDADRAIDHINNTLGTVYPYLSDVFVADDRRYTYNVRQNDGKPIPIITNEYFHSVIIPFIALEILARDEEFTTIFTKYQEDLKKGTFTMFNKEFNYVPDRFKRNRAEGVFFPAGAQKQSFDKRTKNEVIIDNCIPSEEPEDDVTLESVLRGDY